MRTKRRKTCARVPAERRKTCARVPADEEEFTLEIRDASPAHLLIKIKSFSMLWKHGIWKYESREFVGGGYKWRLTIYPDGDESAKEGDHISAHLSMVETGSLPLDWEVNAMFNVFLFNQIADNYLCFRGKARRFHAMNPQWGFSKLISKKILTDPSNGYLVDDKCVFGAEVFVIKSQRVIDCVYVLGDREPFRHDFTIFEFSKLRGVWTSRVFSAGDYRWKIWLYPNGNGSGKGRSVSIYLECVDANDFAPHQKLKAKFCMRIKNKIHDTHGSTNLSQWFTSSQPDGGLQNFIPISDMCDRSKGFVVNDCCFLETEITLQVDAAYYPE